MKLLSGMARRPRTRRTGVPPRSCSAQLAALLLLSWLLAGCREQAPAPRSSDKLVTGATIVFIGPAGGGLRWQAMLGGARKAIQSFPAIKLRPLLPSDGSDTALRDAVDRALGLQPDVLCLTVFETGEATDIAERVFDIGVPLITVGSGPKLEKSVAHVRIDLTGGAQLLGAHIPEILGDRRSYVLLSCQGRSRTDTSCYARFMQAARHHSGVYLLDERCGTGSVAGMVDEIRDMLAVFPHAGMVVTLRPDVWFDNDPVMLLRDKTRLATLGASPRLWPLLRSGRAAALCGPIDGRIGHIAMDAAIVVLTRSRQFSPLHIVPCELVRPDSLDDFARRYAEAGGMRVEALLPPATTRPATHQPGP